MRRVVLSRFIALFGLGITSPADGAVALITGSSHLHLAVVDVDAARGAPGVWGAYRGAPLPGLAMVEGGQARRPAFVLCFFRTSRFRAVFISHARPVCKTPRFVHTASFHCMLVLYTPVWRNKTPRFRHGVTTAMNTIPPPFLGEVVDRRGASVGAPAVRRRRRRREPRCARRRGALATTCRVRISPLQN